MDKLAWVDNLQNMSDEELVKFARKQGLKFSVTEVQKLRKIFKDASFTWLFSGVPTDVMERAEKVIGAERMKQLMKLIG